MADLAFRRALPEDAPALAAIGRLTLVQTFVEDFDMGYPEDDLRTFLDRTYAPEVFARRIADPTFALWAVEREGEMVGYACAGPCGLPHPEVAEGDGELKQIYLRRDVQGSGFGRVLLEETLRWLDPERARTVWLGVWSGNARAQRVYARHGFEKAGEYEFLVGRVRDHEFIMRRLPAASGAAAAAGAR